MNEKIIWDFLQSHTNNAFGTAAIMGNFMAESSLNPYCANGLKDGKQYASDADSGKNNFVHDGRAFGLVQWCYWSRKEALLNRARSEGKSVGDIDLQLRYMWDEFQKYKTAYNAVMNATNIREASDVVMLRYEKPGNTSESAKVKRANYGQKFYDEFAGKQPEPKPVPVGKKMVIAKANVNVRCGDALSYGRITRLNAGDQKEWVATSNGWHAIRLSSQIGWVSGEFVEVN